MDTTIPRDSFLALARCRKAESLAATLHDLGIPADTIMALPNRRRREIETLAGVKIGSDTTWGIACLILHAEEGTTVTPKPEPRPVVTVAEIHEAIQAHQKKHHKPSPQPTLFP